MKIARHLPLVGIAVAAGLFVVAANRYPGGTSDFAGAVGFNMTQNFISSLFQPKALNGAPNPARTVAIPAMFLLCASVGFVFHRIATKATTPALENAIEIGGIGTAVYAFLIATPMHNLMIGLALAFATVALVATTRLLYVERLGWLATWGAICLALELVSGTMFFAHLQYNRLPVMQKVSTVALLAWLVTVYYTRFGRERQTSS